MTFDVTHTLIRPSRVAEVYAQVLARHGIDLEPDAVRRTIPVVWREMACRSDPRRDRFTSYPGGPRAWWHRFLERLCELLGAAAPSRFASAELFDRFTDPAEWVVYPDVRPLLGALREAGLRLGVVSNFDPRLPALLAGLDLVRFFDAIVYSSAVGCEKPHPRIFLDCLERLGVGPSSALHVGDAPVEDVEGAAAAGLAALLVERRGDGDELRRLVTPWLDITGRVRSHALL